MRRRPSFLFLCGRWRQEAGAALLAAMLTVSLVATFASAALWQQWRSVEIEQADRERVQSAWILTGALDWARLILREDARSGGADHLAEPWAVPLQEARLTTFLAADKKSVLEDEADEVFLSGEIVDLQSRLNVRNLAEAGRVSEPWRRSFARLFSTLGLPESELNRMTENYRRATDMSADDRSGAPLEPQEVSQLTWLGLSAEVLHSLAPFVTILPQQTPVNLNTASAEVIQAVSEEMSMADAQRMVVARDARHFRTTADASKLAPNPDKAFPAGMVGVATRFFEVRGRLRRADVVVEEASVVRRDGTNVRALQRQRSVSRGAGQATVGQ